MICKKDLVLFLFPDRTNALFSEEQLGDSKL